MRLFFRLLPVILVVNHLYASYIHKIDCEYVDQEFLINPNTSPGPEYRKFYTCQVKNKINFNGNQEDWIKNPKKESDVKGFLAKDNHTIFAIPNVISKRFPNLECMRISKVKLKKVTRNDLENFKELIHLDLSNNDIKYLEADIFKGNPKLTTICLNNNEIFFIDFDALNGLKTVHLLQLHSNVCFDNETRSLVDAKILILSNACQHNLSYIFPSLRINITDTFVDKIMDKLIEVDEKIGKIDDEKLASHIGEQATRLTYESQRITGEIEKLQNTLNESIIQNMKNVISDIKGEITTLNKKIDEIQDKHHPPIIKGNVQTILLLTGTAGVFFLILFLLILNCAKICSTNDQTRKWTGSVVTYHPMTEQNMVQLPFVPSENVVPYDVVQATIEDEPIYSEAQPQDEDFYQEVPNNLTSESNTNVSYAVYAEIHKK